ncbi:MAG: hybrid sensor histidine kinase/response regulator [Chloroflexia bacterium]|nr:hybrid sensor histidine kinase/response regulator [Chloroflexia bacterium]
MDIQPAHILVVDDNEMNRNLLLRRLRPQGYHVSVAEDGRQALDMLREQSFDLMLLDIMMPGMNGYQVLEEVKADPVLRHVPVIVISAIDELESVVRCIELGAEDYLPKPFNKVLLRARIGNSLAKKRLHDQERAAREALEAAHQTKNRFISIIAHEFRNFVTPIDGYLELLRGGLAGEINEDQAEFLQVIWANVQRIKTLLLDLDDVPRIASGELQLQLEDVALQEVLSEVTTAMGKRFEAKQQNLRVDLPRCLPSVRADRTRLVQVLTNLLSNAHKYTPEGGGIRVWAERLGEEPGALHVAVQDSGIGIAPEEQDRVFLEFFRSTDEKVRETPGVGLGLNITRRLVEMQDGTIWFESEFRRGTTFHFTLPLAEG